MMSDERILGDSDFVDSILSETGETLDRHYELKALGYDFDRVVRRVGELLGMEPREILTRGRQDRRVKARSLVCYWAVRELGMSMSELAREFGMSIAGIGYAVGRGERIARDNDYQLIV
jgi:chromosomal replication initiation ATPase DnaA